MLQTFNEPVSIIRNYWSFNLGFMEGFAQWLKLIHILEIIGLIILSRHQWHGDCHTEQIVKGFMGDR